MYNRNTKGQFATGNVTPPDVIQKIIAAHKSIPRTEEVRTKISKSHFGIRPSEKTRLKMSLAKIGKPAWNKGKPQTDELKLKNSIAHRGENGSGWKGGLTKLIEIVRRGITYRNWRTAVFQRDNFTCVWCGANKKYLNADHITQFALMLRENKIQTLEEAENFPDLWDINNGRTLCVDCHKETDTYLNKGKQYLKQYGL